VRCVHRLREHVDAVVAETEAAEHGPHHHPGLLQQLLVQVSLRNGGAWQG
jgi:hypothetical protein